MRRRHQIWIEVSKVNWKIIKRKRIAREKQISNTGYFGAWVAQTYRNVQYDWWFWSFVYCINRENQKEHCRWHSWFSQRWNLVPPLPSQKTEIESYRKHLCKIGWPCESRGRTAYTKRCDQDFYKLPGCDGQWRWSKLKVEFKASLKPTVQYFTSVCKLWYLSGLRSGPQLHCSHAFDAYLGWGEGILVPCLYSES